MIRVSSLVLGAFAAILATTAGCKVSVETKTRYAEQDVPLNDTQDWAGESITIQSEGVGVAVNGGVDVRSDPAATRITANVRVLAMAFAENKADADLSIADVKAGMSITRDAATNSIRLFCPNGKTHGGSNGEESGCEKINVVVPAGTADRKLSVKILSGNGTMTLQFFNATIGTIEANANGAGGDINADLPATQGGSISLVSEKGNDVAAKLPQNFATDRIELVADADKVDLGPFTDITASNGTTGRGQAGTGLASLKLTSKEFAGSTGNIFLQ